MVSFLHRSEWAVEHLIRLDVFSLDVIVPFTTVLGFQELVHFIHRIFHSFYILVSIIHCQFEKIFQSFLYILVRYKSV